MASNHNYHLHVAWRGAVRRGKALARPGEVAQGVAGYGRAWSGGAKVWCGVAWQGEGLNGPAIIKLRSFLGTARLGRAG